MDVSGDLPYSCAYETPKRSRRDAMDESLNTSFCNEDDMGGSISGDYYVRNEAHLKRGRPRAEVISSLIVEGQTSHSSIRCETCNRVFPREKSLQAHKRIHTGEKPYACDYPGCGKAFTQSGQLKTHQRLHTGEKPFICTVPGCASRFTHANRHCVDHPFASLRRCHELCLQSLQPSENSPEVLRWLESYKKRNEEKTPGKTSCDDSGHESWQSDQQENSQLRSGSNGVGQIRRPPRTGIAKSLQYGSTDASLSTSPSSMPLYRTLCQAVDPTSSFGCTPLQWSPSPAKSRKSSPGSSMHDTSSGYESSQHPETPRPEKPKRRWLREALTTFDDNKPRQYDTTAANMLRPTVLMMVGKGEHTSPVANRVPTAVKNPHSEQSFQPIGTSTPVAAKPDLTTRAMQNAEKQWTGAIALMQLASTHC